MGKSRALLFYTGIIVAFVFLLASQAAGQEIVPRNLIVDNEQGAVQLRFGLRVLNSEKLSRYLKQGTSLRLHCTAKMEVERSFWWDKELRQSAITFMLRYDSLDDEYLLIMGKDKSEKRDSDLLTLLHSGWAQIRMDLGPWPEEYKEDNLVLYLTVRMVRIDVPLWLKRTLFFWSWDVVPVKNYRIRLGS